MSTNQPQWQFLANLGDVDPIQYDGLFVYSDATGVYAPEMERLERISEDSFMIYRVCLEKCAFVDGLIVHDKDFARADPHTYAEWFGSAIGLTSVCASQGFDREELIKALCSENPIDRAQAYRAIYDHYGWENGDSEPLHLSENEVRTRYTDGEI